jgi:hypothetical protein
LGGKKNETPPRGTHATGNEATRSSVDVKGTSVSLMSVSLHAPTTLHAGEAGGTSASISDPLAMVHPFTSRATPCNTVGGGLTALCKPANGESHWRIHAAGVVSAHAGQSVRLPLPNAPTVQSSEERRCVGTSDSAGFTSARLNNLVAETPHQPAAAGLGSGPKSVHPSW